MCCYGCKLVESNVNQSDDNDDDDVIININVSET